MTEYNINDEFHGTDEAVIRMLGALLLMATSVTAIVLAVKSVRGCCAVYETCK